MLALFLMHPDDASAQRHPGFVDVATLVPGLIVDLRYLGPNNFVGAPIDGYERPVCLLTREAATALATAASELSPKGLVFKVFDCYRPLRAVQHFVRWGRSADSSTKAVYYPTLERPTCSDRAISLRARPTRAVRPST